MPPITTISSRSLLYCNEQLNSSSDSESSVAVLSYTYNDFFNIQLSDVVKLPTFSERIGKFTALFSQFPSKQSKSYSQAWIELPEKESQERYLSLITYHDRFDSNSVAEKEVAAKNELYQHVKLFEDEEHKKLLLQLVWDSSGKNGELLHLRKGETISGSEVKNIALHILDALKIDRVILHDTAKLTLTTEGTNSHTLLMASYLPIVSDDAMTWYGRDGFTPLSCKELLMHNKKTKKTQDPLQYAAAIEKIRNFALSDLAKLFWKVAALDKNKIALCHLTATYLCADTNCSFITLEKASISLAGKTVAELGQKIFMNMKEQNNSNDFILFYNLILPNFSAKKPSKKLKAYLELGQELRSVCLWEKTYNNK